MLWLLFFPCQAYTHPIDSVKITPTSPYHNDEIKIICYNSMPTENWKFIGTNVNIQDSIIEVVLEYEFGDGMNDPWIWNTIDTISLGYLSTGKYTITSVFKLGNLRDTVTSILFVSDTVSQKCFVDSIKIIPELPTVDDEVKIVYHNTSLSGPATLGDSEVEVLRDEINVILYYDIGDTAVVSHSVDTLSIGYLDVNNYTVKTIFRDRHKSSLVVDDFLFMFTVPYTKMKDRHIDRIEKIPEKPTTNDEIKVVYYNGFPYGPATLENYVVNISMNNEIIVHLHYNIGGTRGNTYSFDTIVIGHLKAGTHKIKSLFNDYHKYDDYVGYVAVTPFVNITEITSDDNIDIFPNPFKSEINIISDLEIKEVEIYSIDGKRVVMDNIRLNISKSIDLSNLKKGMYLIVLTNKEGHRFAQKIVKQ